MPIYEYKCNSCGHVFEEWQKDFKEREVSCPKCGNNAKRLISHTSFILKGSGWYVTDYGKSSSSSSSSGNGNGNGAKKKEVSSNSSKSTSSSTQKVSKTN